MKRDATFDQDGSEHCVYNNLSTELKRLILIVLSMASTCVSFGVEAR